MKPKTMILMVIAIGCGLAASYMTSKLLAERKQEGKPEETVTILVSKQQISQYTIIKEPEKLFVKKTRRKKDAPESYFTEFSEVKDRIVNKELNKDVHIAPTDLLDKNSAGLEVPPGQVAIALKITATTAVGGYIYPGHRVGVILTTQGKEITTRTLLQNILILAVGDNTSRPNDPQQKSLLANTVVVAVDQKQAQLLRLAEKKGDLSLFLNKDGSAPTDFTHVTTDEDLNRILGLSPPKPTLPDVGKAIPEIPPTEVKPESEPKPIKPAWVLVIENGAELHEVPYFEKDGQLVRGAPASESVPGGTPASKPKGKEKSPKTPPAQPKVNAPKTGAPEKETVAPTN